MPDPRVVEPRRGSRCHQERWNRTKKHTDGLSQQRSGLREASLGGKVEMSQERAPTKRISRPRSRQKDPYAHRGLAATVLAGGNTRALRVTVTSKSTDPGRAPWQEEGTRKYFSTVLIHHEQSCTSELFKVIQDAVSLILFYRTMSLFRTVSSSTFVVSDVQSIYIPSSTQE